MSSWGSFTELLASAGRALPASSQRSVPAASPFHEVGSNGLGPHLQVPHVQLVPGELTMPFGTHADPHGQRNFLASTLLSSEPDACVFPMSLVTHSDTVDGETSSVELQETSESDAYSSDSEWYGHN